MRRIIIRAILVALFMLAAAPGIVAAHERRDVGKLQLVVGFINEPSILGEPNGIDLRIADKASGQPVDGMEALLTATIRYGGGQAKVLPLRARFGMKGAYTADVIPTRAGTYIFNFTGTYDGAQIDETFESGPGRFADVEDAAKLQFPRVVPFAGDVAAQAQAAEARASQATTFGYVGTGLGAVGILVGLAALLRRPGASRAAEE